MLYCLSSGFLNFREAEELVLRVIFCNTNVTKQVTAVNFSPQRESRYFPDVLKFVKKITLFK